MIACPVCDRDFTKRSGLMVHMTRTHAAEAANAHEIAYAASVEDLDDGDSSDWADDGLQQVDEGFEGSLEPSPEQTREIRSIIRAGHTHGAAYERVMGRPLPPRRASLVRLDQVTFRVRNGTADAQDARFLLELALCGKDAMAILLEMDEHLPLFDRWEAALQ